MAIYQGETRVANNYQIDNSVYCVPIGSIIPYASTTLPKGFLLCDGAEISKADYADLYAVIGDTFGAATDNTKFKLPDLRDKFVQGANGNLGISKEAGLPNITGEWIPGSVPDSHTQYTKGAVRGTSGVSDNIASYTQKQTSGYGFSFDASKSNSIYGKSTTVQPPAVCLCYIIKATKLSDIPVDVSGVIDDNTTGADSTWSSEKLNNQLQSVDALTLNGKNTTNFAQNLPFWTGKDVKELLLAATSGFVFIRNDVTGMPIDNTYWFGIVDASSVHRCLTVHQIDGKYSGYCTYNSGSGKWRDWTSLADGGNAAMLGGKSVDVFLQNQGILSNGDLLEHILTMTDSGYFFASSGVTSTPVEGQWFWIDVRRDERGDYLVTASRYNQGGVYTNRYNNNTDMKKWYGWSNVADGGNAATVSGHTVLTNVPANAKFTGINDTSTTSTTETWSAKKINDSSFAGRIVISADEALSAIEDIMNTPEPVDTSASAEERIASALEYQILTSMPDEE